VYEKTPVTTARRVMSPSYGLLGSMVHTLSRAGAAGMDGAII
jgi:hypothetical protein